MPRMPTTVAVHQASCPTEPRRLGCPPLRVHLGEDIVLYQVGQPQINGREGSGVVVGRDASSVLGGSTDVHVDADQNVGLGEVGAHIPSCHIIELALYGEEGV